MSRHLEDILPPKGPRRVVVVGDLILDEILRGRVQRLSPEAPVPVLESTDRQQRLGGAANVAHNLVTLGCQAQLCGIVGDDGLGVQLGAAMQSAGIDVTGVVTVPGRATTHKLRVVGQGQHVVRIDHESREAVHGPFEESLFGAFRDALTQGAAGVILSDYRKGVLTPPLLARIIRTAREAGVPVLVDPKPGEMERYRGATVLTPNLHELYVATGVDVGTAQGRERAARQLMDSTECRAVLVTCGGEGLYIVERDRPPVTMPTDAREVYDVTGAGDTVAAVLGLGLFANLDLSDAARLANAAAAVVVGKLGTSVVRPEELARQLLGGQGSEQKVLPVDALLEALDHERARDRRVVFTNGCFDILHAGHVDYLQRAADEGDVLVVGVNSDRSVAALKGPRRPFVPVEHRAAVLAGLSSVRYVVIFDQDTPRDLIERIRPDVLVKGSDYAPEDVVGRDVVESAGGRLVLVPLLEGVSTTALVDRIAERRDLERG